MLPERESVSRCQKGQLKVQRIDLRLTLTDAHQQVFEEAFPIDQDRYIHDSQAHLMSVAAEQERGKSVAKPLTVLSDLILLSPIALALGRLLVARRLCLRCRQGNCITPR